MVKHGFELASVGGTGPVEKLAQRRRLDLVGAAAGRFPGPGEEPEPDAQPATAARPSLTAA
jgi:hypothetical protein